MNWIHGTAYYPELWSRSVWEEDIKHMKKLGINTVRIGEFAWSAMEPNEDEFHFEKFDEILSLLYENEISVIMCTPTPTPPIWISYGHPERMYNDGGIPFSHGGRQHVCTNNPYFRERVKIIVTEMAKHFGQHPGIIAWQIDNELKCDVGECFCEECGRQWHQWLAHKYASIDDLNEAWGNDVWSMTYHSFEQIPQPIRVPKLPSPSLTLNYTLFSYEKVEEFFKTQTDIIRKYSDKPITHNASSNFGINNDSLSKLQDFVSFDSYPTANDYLGYLFDCRRFRGLKPSGEFMCMETSPGFNGCTKSYDPIHPSGFLAAEATATFALGGIGFSYWHFHQHRSGCEITHGSMLTADGTPTICYPEVEKVRDRIASLKQILDNYTLITPKIAIQYSDNARASMKTENYHGMNYNSLLREFHDVLTERQYAFNIIPDDADVSQYDVVFTPFQYSLKNDFIKMMKIFCENGGTWIVGPMTDIRTEDHKVQNEGAISPELQSILGIKNTLLYPTLGSEYQLSFDGVTDAMRYFTLSGELNGSVSLANVQSLGKRGATFTCHILGKGRAILFGAMPERREMLSKMVVACLEKANIQPIAYATPDIITVALKNNNSIMIFGFNMGSRRGKFSAFGKTLTIEPYGFGIIEK